MKRIPRISETEWELMKIIWEVGPATAATVLERLRKQDPEWHPKTCKTLLGRLVRKGALHYEEQGRAYLYRAAYSEAECVAAVSESFLQRVFSGGLKPMLAHFIESRRLSAAETKELRRILDGREK
jgi:BlaI family transcriptional regulator, penicillinase repressor